jgi:ATP-dependent Clp protease protease subunit
MPDEPIGTVDRELSRELLKHRIVVLGREVRDDDANEICGRLLLLAAEDSHADIWLYINSPGGSVSAGMAIYDTMRLVSCDVATVAMGFAASMGQFLLTAGARGKRFALPNARIVMHQPLGGIGGSATDVRIQAQQMQLTKEHMARITAEMTGQPLERIMADADRDRWFSADEARDYGIVDHVMGEGVLGEDVPVSSI